MMGESRWDLPELLRQVPAQVRFQHPLARYTSFRIGGPADAFVQVEDVEGLRRIRAIARQYAIPLFILGGGSNVLIRDGGIRGIVLALRGAFRSFKIGTCVPLEAGAETGDEAGGEAMVRAGVGCSLSRLAMRVARESWSGLEFAYGIPGTLGGAMVMNAGTYLGELSEVMVEAEVMLEDGAVQALPTCALGLGYRRSSYPPGAIVLGATLRLQRGDRETIEATMRECNTRRQRTQPLSVPNAGSIFKNPSGAAAAKLIDELGLKGARIGGAMVSPVHANFLVNAGQATAADVEALMAMIQDRVWQAHGVALEPEVRVVGEAAF